MDGPDLHAADPIEHGDNNIWGRTKIYRNWAAWSLLALIALVLFAFFTVGQRVDMTFSKIGAGLSEGAPSAIAPQSGGASGSDVNATSEQPTSSQSQSQDKAWDRMIIRTANLDLTVKDVGASINVVQRLAADHGGYVLQLDSHREDKYTVSSITLQVPSQDFDKIMPELRALNGQVKEIAKENISSNDVTEEYTDLQSQLRNLQATEARMLALQQKAEKLEDILALDRELRQTQGDIEKIQGRVNFLSKRSAMSTITVNLTPVQVPAEAAAQPGVSWQPAEAARKAWNASLDLLAGIGTVLITVTVFLWWALPLILLVLWFAARSRRRSTPAAPSTTSGGA